MFIPDSISSDELQQYIDDKAKPDLELIAGSYLDAMLEEMNGDPLIHKVAALMIIKRLIKWHNLMADQRLSDGRVQEALAWTEDQGRLGIAFATLRGISIGDDDQVLMSEND